MSIGHIDCCAPTCTDDVAFLTMTTLCLLLILYVVNYMYYICHGCYNIYATESVDVMLNDDPKQKDTRPVMLGSDEICKSQLKQISSLRCLSDWIITSLAGLTLMHEPAPMVVQELPLYSQRTYVRLLLYQG